MGRVGLLNHYPPAGGKGVAGNCKSAPKGWPCQRKRDCPDGMPMAQTPVLTNRNRIRGLMNWTSKHIIGMSKTPTDVGTLSKYGRHRGKEGILIWQDPGWL